MYQSRAQITAVTLTFYFFAGFVRYILKQLKCKWNVFFVVEFERAAKIIKVAVYRFLMSLLVPEL